MLTAKEIAAVAKFDEQYGGRSSCDFGQPDPYADDMSMNPPPASPLLLTQRALGHRPDPNEIVISIGLHWEEGENGGLDLILT